MVPVAISLSHCKNSLQKFHCFISKSVACCCCCFVCFEGEEGGGWRGVPAPFENLTPAKDPIFPGNRMPKHAFLHTVSEGHGPLLCSSPRTTYCLCALFCFWKNQVLLRVSLAPDWSSLVSPCLHP